MPRIAGGVRSSFTSSDASAAAACFNPIQAVFQTRNGRMYHPVASAVDRLGGENGPIETFHITFTEDVAAVDHSEMPKHLSALATVLRFTLPLSLGGPGKVDTKGTPTELDVERIHCAMTRMQSSGNPAGWVIRPLSRSLFPDEVDRIRIRRIYARWALINNPERYRRARPGHRAERTRRGARRFSRTSFR